MIFFILDSIRLHHNICGLAIYVDFINETENEILFVSKMYFNIKGTLYLYYIYS
jgi:hypothetical protein